MNCIHWTTLVPAVWGLSVLAGACGGTSAADITGASPDVDSGATSETGTDAGGSADGGTDATSNTDAPDGAGCPDSDGDGVTTCQGDCNDGDAMVFPTNTEICGDSKDNNCNAQADEGCNGKGTYVSGETGSDSNAGTQAQPLKTIAKGMANAKAIGGTQVVFVAGSHYPENVDLAQGISLSGGYLCSTASCPWSRDPKVNDTAILNQRPEGVVADNTITSATRIDGFRIQGFNASGGGTLATYAVSCVGGSPTISNNVINGGSVVAGSSNRTAAVYVSAPTNDQTTGVVLDLNAIKGGDVSSANTFGVFLARAGATNPAVAKITRNTLRGGALGVAGSTSAVVLAGSGPSTLVANNDITAASAGGVGRTWGIRAFSAATIDGNRINTDFANVGTCFVSSVGFCGGGLEVAGTQLVITNNVVFGVKGNGTTAAHLSNPEGATSGLLVLNGNYLDGGGSGGGVTPTLSAALSFRIAGGTNAVVGKVRNNILMGGTNQYRYGVYEERVAGKSCHPEAFDHNDVFFATLAGTTDVVYHADNGSTASDLTLAQLQASTLTTPAPSSNLSADCLVGAGYRLGATSPCANAGTSTEAPAKDFEGEARPKGAGIDIGPDEAN